MFKKKKPAYSETDFVEELLPRNRKEEFKFIFKTRKSLLGILCALMVVFAIPLIIALLFKDNYVYNFYLMYENGKINEEGFLLLTAENNVVFTGICALCLLFYSICLAGVFNILKKLVTGEPIFVWKDLLHGLKINIVYTLILTFILGGLLTLLALAFRYLFFDVFFIIILIIFVVFIFPYFAGLYFYKSMYSASFKQTLYNGIYLYRAIGIKGIFLLFGLVIIPVVSNILAETLVITGITNLVINVLYFLFFLPIYLLLLYCFYYSIFDLRLNKNLFPEYYMRGLYKPEDNEEVLDNEVKIEK